MKRGEGPLLPGCRDGSLSYQANARQWVTLISVVWKGRKMCFTLPHIQKLKNDFSMELTIIETSAYQELRRLVSTLAVQMGDFQKKIAPPAPDK